MKEKIPKLQTFSKSCNMWECKSFLRIFRIISVLKMLKAEKSFVKENFRLNTQIPLISGFQKFLLTGTSNQL